MSRPYPELVEIEQAVEIISRKVSTAGTEQIPLYEADGRILAEGITAKENIPPFDRSPYDGYAFRAQDVASAGAAAPVTLQIIEEVPAGHVSTKRVEAGEAVKILTGAPIPEGADVVEKFESTIFDEHTVQICSPLKPGSNICRAGEDVRVGEMLVKAGSRITSAAFGLLAGLGYARIKVYRQLKASIISTGSELVPVEAALTPGKIRNSSSYMLCSTLKKWGVAADIYGIVEDRTESIIRAIEECAGAYDVIVTTGGVSVGDYDLVEEALVRMGAKILLWKVKMKPGMAFLAAIYQGKLILGLSGNPSAAAASLYLIGKPVLGKMSGLAEYGLKKCRVSLLQNVPKKSPGRRLIPGVLRIIDTRACLDAKWEQGNGMLSQWNGCSLIGEIPPGTPPLEKGTVIEAYYLAE